VRQLDSACLIESGPEQVRALRADQIRCDGTPVSLKLVRFSLNLVRSGQFVSLNLVHSLTTITGKSGVKTQGVPGRAYLLKLADEALVTDNPAESIRRIKAAPDRPVSIRPDRREHPGAVAESINRAGCEHVY
jgi:hypothetical protein